MITKRDLLRSAALAAITATTAQSVPANAQPTADRPGFFKAKDIAEAGLHLRPADRDELRASCTSIPLIATRGSSRRRSIKSRTNPTSSPTRTRPFPHRTAIRPTLFESAMGARAKRLALTHHDPLRDDEAVDRVVEMCRRRASTAGSGLEVFAAAEGQELRFIESDAKTPAAARAPKPATKDARPRVHVHRGGSTRTIACLRRRPHRPSQPACRRQGSSSPAGPHRPGSDRRSSAW